MSLPTPPTETRHEAPETRHEAPETRHEARDDARQVAPRASTWERWLLLALMVAFGWLLWQQQMPQRPDEIGADAPRQPAAQVEAQAKAPQYRTLSPARVQAALADSTRRDDLEADLYRALFAPYRYWLRQARGRVPDFASDLTDAGSTVKRLGKSVQDLFGGERLDDYVRGHFQHYMPLERFMQTASQDAKRGAEQVVAQVASDRQRRVTGLLGKLSIQPPADFTVRPVLDVRWLDHMGAVSRDTAGNAAKGALIGAVSGPLLASVLGLGGAAAPETLGASAVAAVAFAGVVTVFRNDAEEAELRYAAYAAIDLVEARLDAEVRAEAARLAQLTMDQLEADTAQLLTALEGRAIRLPYNDPLAVEFAQ